MTRNAEAVHSVASRLGTIMQQRGNRSHRADVLALGTGDASRKEAERVAGHPDIIVGTTQRVIDHIRRENLDVSRVRLCVVDEPNEDDAVHFNADLEYIYSKIQSSPQSVVFVATEHEQLSAVMSLLRRPAVVDLSDFSDLSPRGNATEHSTTQERAPMYDQDYKHLFSDETLKEWIESILEEIHEEEDPDELDAYRKIIKRDVPFFRRGYFAAYLLKQLRDQSGGGRGSSRGGRKKPADRKDQRRSRKGRDRSGDGSSDRGGDRGGDEPKEGYKTMFVGVGKNRKVFPRDLIQLFSGVDDISGSDIGQIKILDNYSFVELAEDKAENAIAELNGKEYRGRKLNVNYARKKD